MPKLRHEAVVEVLQNEPLLVPLLLAYAGAGVRFPRRPAAVIADSNLSDRDGGAPKTYLADNVFVFEDDDYKVAVVAEVQTGRPGRARSLKWPAYAASARARHGCDTLLLVFAVTKDAALGSARTIRTGHPGFDLRPLLTGVGRMPAMPPPGWARLAPELVLLNVITGDLRLDTHEARMLALQAVRFAPPARFGSYTRYIRLLVPPSVRGHLEVLMKTVFKDAFVDGLLDQGRAQGRAQGSVQTARQMVLELLGMRFSVPEDIRGRVNACTDTAVLNAWFRRAVNAASLDEVFTD
jgi:hypothetical protein